MPFQASPTLRQFSKIKTKHHQVRILSSQQGQDACNQAEPKRKGVHELDSHCSSKFLMFTSHSLRAPGVWSLFLVAQNGRGERHPSKLSDTSGIAIMQNGGRMEQRGMSSKGCVMFILPRGKGPDPPVLHQGISWWFKQFFTIRTVFEGLRFCSGKVHGDPAITFI